MKSNSAITAAQGLLIRIARIAWSMYSSFIKQFTAFNAIYTISYGEDALKQVETTAALPSDAAVNAKLTALLNTVKATALVCTDYWQNLASYIVATFDAPDQEAAKKEAGSALYKNATSGNWSDLLKLLEQMTTFINHNIDTLTKDGNGMPAGFPAMLATARTACESALQAHSIARQTAKLQTAARQWAYKNVQLNLMAMLKDARQIFKRNDAALQMFTFADIKRSFSPEKTSICITVKNSNDVAVTTSHLSVQSGKFYAEGNANAKGIISIKIPPGVYTCTLTTPAYETKVLMNVKVSSGGTKRIKATLTEAIPLAIAQ